MAPSMLPRAPPQPLPSHFLVSCRSLWLLCSCNFEQEHVFDTGQNAPYMASPYRLPWYPVLLPFYSLTLFFSFLLVLSTLRYLIRNGTKVSVKGFSLGIKRLAVTGFFKNYVLLIVAAAY